MLKGPSKEVFFEQRHEPGQLCASDFTHMSGLVYLVSALVLVPEIALTPQTISRFEGRCGNVAVMHSHLTNAERGGYWRRVASGPMDGRLKARSLSNAFSTDSIAGMSVDSPVP